MPNNFSTDSNCKALWRFENGALTTDSKGTNTLTASGSPTANTGTYKEGAAATNLVAASTQYYSITDANLNAEFPFKNGDTNKINSICSWFYLNSRPAADSDFLLVAKYNSSSSLRCFMLTVQTPNPDTGSTLELRLGYNSGASFAEIFHAYTLSISTWYHVTMTYRDSDKSYTLRLKDVSGNTLGTDLDTTWANNISITTASFSIGAFNPTPTFLMDGIMDEVVVFNDIITAAEATQIAQGTYGPQGSVPVYMNHYRNLRA